MSYAAAEVLIERLQGFGAGTRSATASALYRSHLDLESWHKQGGGLTISRALNVHAPTSRGRDDRTHRWDWP
ncbi:hypothetical protein, partial [Mycobacteroides abscessus]|uniref:hypothetical protein n=1 Tax=Mycobacteroides abscessus TaxID=36809 RepID=UPI001A97B7E1